MAKTTLGLLTTAAATAALYSGLASSAAAAPQILAVVATVDALPFTCEHGECGAELSTICLQPDRASPPAGKTYTIHGDAVTLVGTTKDGRKISLPAAAHTVVKAARGHNAVRIAMPLRQMRALRLKDVSVVVGDMVSLIPTPIKGDPRPMTAGDIELATGPMRRLAARLVDAGGAATAAAQIAGTMLNSLPRRGRATVGQKGEAWERALKSSAGKASPAGLKRARRAYEFCLDASTNGVYTLRDCLGAKHDSFIGKQNNTYWDALKFGS